jgi:hypothetical protein
MSQNRGMGHPNIRGMKQGRYGWGDRYVASNWIGVDLSVSK